MDGYKVGLLLALTHAIEIVVKTIISSLSGLLKKITLRIKSIKYSPEVQMQAFRTGHGNPFAGPVLL